MRKSVGEVEEKVTRGPMPFNLQFFGGGNSNTNDSEEGDAQEEDEEDAEDGKDEKNDDQTKGSGKNSDKSGVKSGKTFTQEQVTKMMTREKNQGRNAALKELGIDPKDTKTLKMIQAFVASQKNSEEESAGADTETQQKLQEAADRALKAECKAEAMALGAKREFVDDIVVLAMAKYEEGSEISTLIGEVKTKYKTFFGEESEEEENPVGKKGTGSTIKRDKAKKEEPKSLGSRLAAQRVGTAKKTSNFMKRN